MTREVQRTEFANSQVDCEFFNEDLWSGIIIGAKWADENPDSKCVYTKKQLMDMGFAFTTNGDIVTPDQLNEDLKKYLEYQKQKFIKKTWQWLKSHIKIETLSFSDVWDTSVVDIVATDFNTIDEMEESFRKTMEE